MFNKTVGVYHVFPANRSAMIEELENDEMTFTCEEITHFDKLKYAHSDIIVLFSIAFLTAHMSASEITNELLRLNKTLIIVDYDLKVWQMDRNRTFYLQQKDNWETINNVKSILVMEMMGRGSEYCVGN